MKTETFQISNEIFFFVYCFLLAEEDVITSQSGKSSIYEVHLTPCAQTHETGLKNFKCFCWKCLYSLTAKIDFSDLYSISGDVLINKGENLWTGETS